MKRFPLISCITPTRNRHGFLSDMIAMFLAQTYPNKELIIIDDSPFPFPGVDSLPPSVNYQFIHTKNPLSIGHKRNLAVSLSNGEYIAFMDDDDFHGKKRLSLQMNTILRTKCDVLTPKKIFFNDVTKPVRSCSVFTISSKFTKTVFWNGYITPCMIFKKNLFKFNKFRNVSLGEDSLFIKDLLRIKKIRICSHSILSPSHFMYSIHQSNTWNLIIPLHERLKSTYLQTCI